MEDPEGDVTAPELVITGSNGGVKGHPGVMVGGGESPTIHFIIIHLMKTNRKHDIVLHV